MRRFAVLVVAALGGSPFLGASPVGAGATTDLYLVHGLNLAFQASPDERGAPVTVCTGPMSLIPDFQFGDIAGPIPVPTAQNISVQVYATANVDCAAPADPPLIDQAVNPAGEAFAAIVTSFGDQFAPELVGGPIDMSCVESGAGVASVVNAANVAEMDILSTDLGASLGTLPYNDAVSLVLDAGTYGIEVFVVDGPTDPAVELDLSVASGSATIAYVVGFQPVDGLTPLVVLIQEIVLDACAAPAPLSPAAEPAGAEPAFTG